MEYTLEELKAKLGTFEETYLLELLQVTSEDLVDRFSDIIENRFDQFISELSQEEEPDEEDPDCSLATCRGFGRGRQADR